MSNKISSVILAGGEGRRFRPLTYYIPKPMIPVGSSERPILEFIVRWLSRWGVRDILVLIGYRWRQVVNYFGDGSRFNVRMRYVVDKPPYSNTGGALRRALDLGLLDEYEDVLIWYGDILAPLNVKELIDVHRSSRADVTLVLTQAYKVPVGIATVDADGRVVELSEKPELGLNATIGILMLKVNSAKRAVESLSLGYDFDIMGDMIPGMISMGFNVRSYMHDEFWYDVGSIERYEKLDHGKLEELLGLAGETLDYVIQ
ncbi:MAG: nucleotidyltransferase family protein [Acidilobaceae archaeon]